MNEKSVWFENMDNVIELAQFLVDSGGITELDDLIYYFSKPYKYTDVWNMYYKEVIGKTGD